MGSIMNKSTKVLLIFICVFFGFQSSYAKTIKLDYEGFSVWVDCSMKAAVSFRYNAKKDGGNLKRSSAFSLDSNVPKECQQTSTATYKTHDELQQFDRGHQVTSNHLDHSKLAMKQSNFMTNILPMDRYLNRYGAWRYTEVLTECLRDIDELLVIGGALWSEDNENDYFLKSHGVRTPSAFWKIIIRDDRMIGWVFPNDNKATKYNIDDYIKSVSEIEALTGLKLPVSGDMRSYTPEHTWIIPRGCNRG